MRHLLRTFRRNGGSAVANRFRTVERVVNEEMAKSYAYGSADCFFFGIAMVDALTGSDLRKQYAGSYKTLMGAQKALRKRGFKRLADLFGTHLEPCAPTAAQLGDIVILDLGDGDHVGVCTGQDAFTTKTETGRQTYRLDKVRAAFRT